MTQTNNYAFIFELAWKNLNRALLYITYIFHLDKIILINNETIYVSDVIIVISHPTHEDLDFYLVDILVISVSPY